MDLLCAPCLYDSERPGNGSFRPHDALTVQNGMALCERHWEALTAPDDVRHAANWAWNKKPPVPAFDPKPTLQPHWVNFRARGIGVASGYCVCGDPYSDRHLIYGQNPWPIPDWAIKKE